MAVLKKGLTFLVCEVVRTVAEEIVGPKAVAFKKASMLEGIIKTLIPTPDDRVLFYGASGGGCSILGHVAVRHGSRQLIVTVTEWMIRGGERQATHFTRIIEHDEPINLHE